MDPSKSNLEDVLLQTSGRITLILAVLRRMKDNDASVGFLRGDLLKCPDLHEMLIQLHNVHDVLMPVWSGDADARSAKIQEAGVHLKNLLFEKEEVFEIPGNHGFLAKYTYKAWFKALNKLASCSFWNENNTKHTACDKTAKCANDGNIFDEDIKQKCLMLSNQHVLLFFFFSV